MENRSIWHVVALVATLGLSALVAVVAVTRSDREKPSAEASPSETASPSATASAVGLIGDGPFVVYAVGNEILAYDVAGVKSISLGNVEGFLGTVTSGRQPGSGKQVVFTMADGNILTVSRRGLAHVLAIPREADSGFIAALTSADDRKVAIAKMGSQPSTVIIDLQTKKPTNVKRTKRGQYPPEALIPVAWSLGGTVLYEIPYCDCDSWTPGVYALDTTSAGSTRVPGTSSTSFFNLAAAPSGQALYYGSGGSRSCPPEIAAEACGPPYYIRRLAAGQAGADIIRRATDYPFYVDAISQGGDLILVHRPISESEGARVELYSAEGERQPALSGVPEGGASGVAILPDDVYILLATNSQRSTLLSLRNGTATKIADVPFTGETLTYLGWLS